MINLRDLNLHDIVGIEKVCAPSYGLPDLSNRLNFVNKAILLDDKVVGSAIAHLTSEVSLILDPAISTMNKARILKEVFKVMLSEIKASGVEDTHVFIIPETDEEYEEFLKKHFKFVRATGRPMYLYPR